MIFALTTLPPPRLPCPPSFSPLLSSLALPHPTPLQVSSPAENVAFCTLLRRLVDEHAPMLDSLAQGLREAKARALVGPALQLDSFFDSMLRSRITRRVLAEQHLHISGGGGGIVDSSLSVADAAEFAGQRAAMLCAEVRGGGGACWASVPVVGRGGRRVCLLGVWMGV